MAVENSCMNEEQLLTKEATKTPLNIIDMKLLTEEQLYG